MGQFYYNILTNNRLKNIAIGIFTIFTVCLFFAYINTPIGKGISIFQSLIFSFALIGLSYLLGEVPFGQIMETTPNKNLETFYKLGAFKFNNKILEMPVSVILEQDKKKYYCLTLKMPDGQSIFIEKYPTLAEANERLIELKKIFPK